MTREEVRSKGEMEMTRYEVETSHPFEKKNKRFAGCEGTLEEAKAHIQALIDNGITVVKVEYFDNDTRIADIRAGRV